MIPMGRSQGYERKSIGVESGERRGKNVKTEGKRWRFVDSRRRKTGFSLWAALKAKLPPPPPQHERARYFLGYDDGDSGSPANQELLIILPLREKTSQGWAFQPHPPRTN